MLGPRRKPIATPAVGSKSRGAGSKDAARKRSRSRRRRSRSRRRRSSEASEDKKPKAADRRKPKSEKKEKKEKAYAWMDSGDESGDGAASDSSGAKKRSRSRDRSEHREKRDKVEADERPLPEKLADVRALSDMVRLAQTLQRSASRMQPKEIVAVVTAAAKVKFYDGDVFQSGLLPAARRHLQRSNGSFSPDEAVDLVSGLADLNVYDKVIFSKIVERFAERKQDLEDLTRRGRLLASYKKAGHEGDKDFMEYLTQRQKEENYRQRLAEQQVAGPLIYYGGLRK